MDKINYGLIGYSGRLGTEVINLFKENRHNLVFKSDLENEDEKGNPQIIIDCSLPEAFQKNLEFVKKYNSGLIIATTGLSEYQIKSLKELSKQVPVIQSFNFSIGVQVLLNLTRSASKLLAGWDVEITETHHNMKKDKPSGTAKMIQNIFKDKEVNVSSLRLGGIPGDHKVEFGGMGETLTLSHHAISRRTFAEGILKSAEFIINKKNGFYTFTDVVFAK
jgi:4-hydroxy-tetrahydrodipicolinate reductase